MKSSVQQLTTFTKHFASLILLAILAFGCEKEIITPETKPAVAHFGGQGQLNRPTEQCGASTFATLSDGVNTLGEVEILNNTDKLYVIFDMNLYKFIDELHVFIGDVNDLPMNGQGVIRTEQFPIEPSFTEPVNEYSLSMPLADVNACNTVVIWARVKTLNIWGQTVSSTDAWMTGLPIGNGFQTAYCLGSCLSGNNNVLSVE